MKLKVTRDLINIKLKGGNIIGIGAATKGNTFLNYLKLSHDLIDKIADTSKLKIYKYTPGSLIEIIHDNKVNRKKFTHALILPWNISNYLREKYKNKKLKFYTPNIKKVIL